MKLLLYIFLGGGIGSVFRHLLGLWIDRQLTTAFPAGTFVVNITGCFVIGLLYGIAIRYSWLNVEWRLFLITGICGGYTTFSTFSYQAVGLIREGNYGYFLLYVAGSVVLGLLATMLGTAIMR
ncbi:MAG TPA: fluoride efflux transporter CrcB [Puia sp.]|nr:fluoride efflux transporter CrcB [Puia sp.]